MNRPLWTAAEIAAATKGRTMGDWSIAGVSIDSRTVLPGELFIALQGPLHDGHDFVRAALDRGAAALVAHRPNAVSADAPLVVVDDTMAALTALGQAARARSPARIAAITGSVGKTGTKEALRLALAAQGPIHASAASHNNHWGVPLSLAREPHGTAYGVYELGMNAPGEIATLTRLTRPHVALITTIEAAHLGYFPSVAAIAEAKGEIFQGLEPGGIAVLNADNAHFARLKELAKAAGCERLIAFGSRETADAKLLEARRDPSGSDVVMRLDGREIAYRISAPGQHWVINSLAVIAGVVALGADGEAAARALAGFAPPKGRGQRHRIELAGGVIDLIDESYNANPASMRAALSLLEGRPGRTIAALGDMLELGKLAGEFHAELAEPIAAHGVDLVFTSGASMRHLHDALPPARRGEHAESAAELLPILRAVLQPGDTLLVKGSLGSAMGPIVEALLAADGETQTARAGGG